jgi:hypothetical protein
MKKKGRDPGPLRDYPNLFETLRYPISLRVEELSLVRVPVCTLAAEIDHGPAYVDYDECFKEWMGLHGLDYLPIDAPPLLADDYIDQPKQECLIASAQAPVGLQDDSIDPFYFVIANDRHGNRLGVHLPKDPARIPRASTLPIGAYVLFCRR